MSKKSEGRVLQKDRVRQRCITIYRSQDEALKNANINLSGEVQRLIDVCLLPSEINPIYAGNAEAVFIANTEDLSKYLAKNGEIKTIDHVRKLLDDKLNIPVTRKQAENFYAKWSHLIK
jgi:hypothetical protein